METYRVHLSNGEYAVVADVGVTEAKAHAIATIKGLWGIFYFPVEVVRVEILIDYDYHVID